MKCPTKHPGCSKQPGCWFYHMPTQDWAMPRRDVEFRAGEYYHVYNRGANRQQVFFDRDSYGLFLKK